MIQGWYKVGAVAKKKRQKGTDDQKCAEGGQNGRSTISWNMVVPPKGHGIETWKKKHVGAMETNCADSDDVSVGGATTLTSSWMEQASSIHLSCAQPFLGTCSCRMATRRWRANSCGCRRRTLCCSGEKYRGFLETAGTRLRRNRNAQHRQLTAHVHEISVHRAFISSAFTGANMHVHNPRKRDRKTPGQHSLSQV